MLGQVVDVDRNEGNRQISEVDAIGVGVAYALA
jgi:hypothetical protein